MTGVQTCALPIYLKINEKIIQTNFDNPDKILKIVSKAKSNEEKHMILFNLPEVLRA